MTVHTMQPIDLGLPEPTAEHAARTLATAALRIRTGPAAPTAAQAALADLLDREAQIAAECRRYDCPHDDPYGDDPHAGPCPVVEAAIRSGRPAEIHTPEHHHCRYCVMDDRHEDAHRMLGLADAVLDGA